MLLCVTGSVWISSELKGLNDDCEHFEVFPPGHLYSSKNGGLRRWYNPAWFSEAIPSTPYDTLVLRRAFENVSNCYYLVLVLFICRLWVLVTEKSVCTNDLNEWW